MDELTRLADQLVVDPPLAPRSVEEIRRRGRIRRSRRRGLVAATVAIVVLSIGGAALARAGDHTATVRTSPDTLVPANPSLYVYIDPAASPAQVTALENELVANPDATRIQYWSQGVSYQEFACLFHNEPNLVGSARPASIPASLRIFADGGRPAADRLAQLVTGQPGVKAVSYPPGPMPTQPTVVQLPDGRNITVDPNQGPKVDPEARPRCDAHLQPTHLK